MAGLRIGCKYGIFERHFFHPPQAYKETTSTNAKPQIKWGRIYNYESLLWGADAVTDLQGRRANLPPLRLLELRWWCTRLLVCDQILWLPHLSRGPLQLPASMEEQMCHHPCQKAEEGVANLPCLNQRFKFFCLTSFSGAVKHSASRFALKALFFKPSFRQRAGLCDFSQPLVTLSSTFFFSPGLMPSEYFLASSFISWVLNLLWHIHLH